jgi:hypothetical protein
MAGNYSAGNVYSLVVQSLLQGHLRASASKLALLKFRSPLKLFMSIRLQFICLQGKGSWRSWKAGAGGQVVRPPRAAKLVEYTQKDLCS